MTVERVDAHHHVWDLGVRDQPWITGAAMAAIRRDFGLTDLAPLAAAAGVTATVLVQTVPDPDETPELLALAARSDLVAAVTGWVDLTAPDVAAALDRTRAAGGGHLLRAVRHPVHDEPDPCWLERPDVRRGLRAVGAAGLAYELLVRPRELPAALATARALPEVAFVLDHGGKPPIAAGSAGRRAEWAAAVRALAALPNVTAKLSGLVTEASPGPVTVAALRPYAEVLLDAFGPDRLLAGSDWPVCTLVAPYAEVLALADALVAGLSPAERQAVLAGTARRVYRLDETDRSAGPG